MSSRPPEPIPLSAAEVPDGCRAWDGDRARRWTEALPPRPLVVPVRPLVVVTLVLLCGIVACVLAVTGTVPVLPAALLGLQPVLLATRPEAVRFVAPVLVVAVGVTGPALSWPPLVGAALLAVVLVGLAGLRLAARAGQREAALAATGGVTAELPESARHPGRGRFLAVAGTLLVLVGGGLLLIAPSGDVPEDRSSAAVLGLVVAGLGLSVLGSGYLGRRRATVLGAGPAPVLRVLVRAGRDLGVEVFAADDVRARRPLFTVALTAAFDADAEKEEADDDLDPDLDLEPDLDSPGPLREAVLYGLPYDGAEVVVVSAARGPDEPPLVGWSSGPVRPFSDRAARAAHATDTNAAARAAAEEERLRAAVEASAGRLAASPDRPVRRFGAGGPDRCLALCAVGWGLFLVWAESGLWRYAVGVGLGVVGTVLLPRLLAWRVTADSAGLWVSGLRGPRLIAWDALRSVSCDDGALKLGGGRGTRAWTVSGSRWPWLERRAGYVHPYERTATDLTALWERPELRPATEAGPAGRGRALWPLALLCAAAWTAAVLLLP